MNPPLIVTTFAQAARESGWPFKSRAAMLEHERRMKLEDDIFKFLHPQKDKYEEMGHMLVRLMGK